MFPFEAAALALQCFDGYFGPEVGDIRDDDDMAAGASALAAMIKSFSDQFGPLLDCVIIIWTSFLTSQTSDSVHAKYCIQLILHLARMDNQVFLDEEQVDKWFPYLIRAFQMERIWISELRVEVMNWLDGGPVKFAELLIQIAEDNVTLEQRNMFWRIIFAGTTRESPIRQLLSSFIPMEASE
jgi:hypothetical protein